ncbi:unnamed protein product [Mytilus coruscus]|uniref:Uncharacterized protein n=1 Tax=Mytilus coruscus TaxID=42192 RepID=A0A6J8CED7_MYTCO|nr:unnamed protein product [Mytilus coruscus]
MLIALDNEQIQSDEEDDLVIRAYDSSDSDNDNDDNNTNDEYSSTRVLDISIVLFQTTDQCANELSTKIKHREMELVRRRRTEFKKNMEKKLRTKVIVILNIVSNLGQFPDHTPEVFEKDAIISGHFQFSMYGQTVVLEPGDIVEVPKHTIHNARVVGSEKM